MLSDIIKHDKSSQIIEKKVQNQLKAGKAGITHLNHELFYSSDITKCDRRIMYKAIGTPYSINAKKSLHDRYIVQKWLDVFDSIKGIEVIDKRAVVADQNYNLTGEINCIININDAVAVIMVKEVSDQVFKKGAASRNNIVDIMSQMWMSEVQDGFLIYENEKDREFKVFHVVPNISILNSVSEKCRDLNYKKVSGILPERKYEDNKCDECSLCEFRERCWQTPA